VVSFEDARRLTNSIVFIVFQYNIGNDYIIEIARKNDKATFADDFAIQFICFKSKKLLISFILYNNRKHNVLQ